MYYLLILVTFNWNTESTSVWHADIYRTQRECIAAANTFMRHVDTNGPSRLAHCRAEPVRPLSDCQH